MPEPGIRTLLALHRLRRAETDTARRGLAEALARETALAAEDATYAREVAQARQHSGEFDRDGFAVWLERVRTERARLADAARQAGAASAAARTALAHRRVAETAAAEAVAGDLRARDAALARRDQVMLEDIARALRRPR